MAIAESFRTMILTDFLWSVILDIVLGVLECKVTNEEMVMRG